MNFAEHFCVLVFLECQNYLLGTLLFPIDLLTGGWFVNTGSIWFLLFFFWWDFKQLLGIDWFRSLRLSALSWCLFIALFFIAATIASLILNCFGYLEVLQQKYV